MKKTWQVLTDHLSRVLSFQRIEPIVLTRLADIDYHNNSRMKDGDEYEIGLSFFGQHWHPIIDTESFRDVEKTACMKLFNITETQACMAAYTMMRCHHRKHIQHMVCVGISCEGPTSRRSIFWNVFIPPEHRSFDQLFLEYAKTKSDILEHVEQTTRIDVPEDKQYEFMEPYR